MLKKYFLILAAITLLSILNSCELVTLHPIFTSKDLVFEEGLIGTWKTKDGTTLHYRKARIEELAELSPGIRQNADKIYLLTRITQGDLEETFYAFLVQLGKDLYFDYYPVEVDKSGKLEDFFKMHYVRMHSISRVSLSKNALVLSQFDDEFMNKMIREKNIRIRHEVVDDDNYFITASTAELQQYILKYGNLPEAYGSSKGTVYKRIPDL